MLLKPCGRSHGREGAPFGPRVTRKPHTFVDTPSGDKGDVSHVEGSRIERATKWRMTATGDCPREKNSRLRLQKERCQVPELRVHTGQGDNCVGLNRPWNAAAFVLVGPKGFGCSTDTTP